MLQKIRTAYELSNLLMSLYAVVEYEDCLGCEKTNNYLLDNERKNIDDVVQDKLNTIKRKTKNFLHSSSQKKNLHFSKYVLFMVTFAFILITSLSII